MQSKKVLYKGKSFNCQVYLQNDEFDMLDVLSTWKAYALSTKHILGTSPQLSPAFTQAFCCLRLGLVRNVGPGVDSFELDPSGSVLRAVEIKATSTTAGRNDIKIYDGNVSVARSSRGLSTGFLTPNIGFDKLYWMAFRSSSPSTYEIYEVSPNQIIDYDKHFLPAIRGGRINVLLSRLIQRFTLQTIEKGVL